MEGIKHINSVDVLKSKRSAFYSMRRLVDSHKHHLQQEQEVSSATIQSMKNIQRLELLLQRVLVQRKNTVFHRFQT